RGLLTQSAFETNQENHPALLLVNSREGAIEIAQRQPAVGSAAAAGIGHTLSSSTRTPSRTLCRAPSASHGPQTSWRRSLGFCGIYLLKSAISYDKLKCNWS